MKTEITFGQGRPYKGVESVTGPIKDALKKLLAEPLFGGQKEVVEKLLADIEAREKHGIEKYGTSLETWNGRDPLQDVLEEELDRFQYLVQARKERADMVEQLAALKKENRDLRGDIARARTDIDDLLTQASAAPTPPSNPATPALGGAAPQTPALGPPGAPNGPFVHALCTTGRVPEKRWGDVEDSFRDVMLACYANSALHGFWGAESESCIRACLVDGKSFNVIPEKLCLIHSEVSKALEAYRSMDALDKMHGMGGWLYYVTGAGKPEGYLTELADVFIRLGDLLASMKLEKPFVHAVRAKMAYNASRPHMHGKTC